MSLFSDPPAMVHLRSLSTSDEHPSASNPRVLAGTPHIGVLAVVDNNSSELSIHGDLVGWLIREHNFGQNEVNLQLWQWKTGQLVWVSMHFV